jgi:hypothetical protein
MARRWRRIIVVLVVLLVAGAIALVLTGRAPLQDDEDAVEAAWLPLRPPLTERYEALAVVNDELLAAGGEDRDVTADLTAELERWQEVASQPESDADAEDEVETANTLEGLSARVLATVNGSERLRGSEPLTEALATFAAAVPDPALVRRYNNAVDTYDDTRTSSIRRPAVEVFGFEPRTSLILAT